MPRQVHGQVIFRNKGSVIVGSVRGQRVVRVALITIAATLLASCSNAPPNPPRHSPSMASTSAVSVVSKSAVPRAKSTPNPTAIQHPTGGAKLLRVVIPARDGYRPRPAYLYLPPAAVRDPHTHLPVLELLHGTPGAPLDWSSTRGELVSTSDTFASAHHGEAPIVVMPDLNGTQGGDSECIRTKDGKSTENYLSSDVVSWVRTHFAATVGTEKWWIAGLSEGGLCSLMLALRHPQTYSAFGDFSGLVLPSVTGLTTAASNKRLYGQDPAAMQTYDPLWLFTHRRYADLRGWFECGYSDSDVRAAQTVLVDAATAAHIPVQVALHTGTHSWAVWSDALRSMLPWLWRTRNV